MFGTRIMFSRGACTPNGSQTQLKSSSNYQENYGTMVPLVSLSQLSYDSAIPSGNTRDIVGARSEHVISHATR
jgi:hypothetical protein